MALKLSGNVSLGFGIGTLLLVAAVNTIDFAAAPLRRFLELRWVVQVGLWSFSIYLWQQPFFDYRSAACVCQFPQNLAVVVALAIGCHHLIERPFLRLKDWIGRARHG